MQGVFLDNYIVAGLHYSCRMETNKFAKQVQKLWQRPGSYACVIQVLRITSRISFPINSEDHQQVSEQVAQTEHNMMTYMLSEC